MGVKEDLLAIVAFAKTSVAAIRTDIAEIKDGIPDAGGMNAADTAEVKASLTELASTLDALDLENPGAGGGVDPLPGETSTVNAAGEAAGIGALGTVVANDDPNLATYKANGWVDTVR